ncbi:MAG: hypothetical protein GY854_24780 [Deltaproteobacteria bacterium]|nr:hypothetical protein [Deltaproteobacteria bacterium]
MRKDGNASVLEEVHSKFMSLVQQADLANAEVSVMAKPLTPEEAIGTPGRRDYPIITGKERVVEAVIKGARGHAFTDSPREFVGSIKDVLDLSLDVSQNRAIFIAALNAFMMHLEMIEASVHCKDEDPERCAMEIAPHILSKYGKVNVGLVGLNPAIAESLVETFGLEHVRITDLNTKQVGEERFGVKIMDGNLQVKELVESSDVVLMTGTTLVNGTFDSLRGRILESGKALIVYGVTAAGISELLGFERICPYGSRG